MSEEQQEQQQQEKQEYKAKGILTWVREIEKRVDVLEEELEKIKMYAGSTKEEVKELKKEIEYFF